MSENADHNTPVSSDRALMSAVDAVAPAGWKGKLAKVFFQLVAGSDKGAAMYAVARERIDTVEGRSTVNKALAKAVAEQAVQDSDIMERAKARFLSDALQKQNNLEAVVLGSAHHLRALPAPPATLGASKPNVESEPNVDAEQEEGSLNPDWAATFSAIAENATTADLRDRLSRILAGEMASPGTYSRATIRAISELEKRDLEAMKAVLPYVLDSQIVRRRDGNSPPTVDMLLPLADAGLINDANPLLSKTWDTAPPEGTSVLLPGLEWALGININANQSLALPVVPLTRAGIAVVDLLGRPDERDILNSIAADIPKHIFSKIWMGRKSPTGLAPPVEQIFPKPIKSDLITQRFQAFGPINLS